MEIDDDAAREWINTKEATPLSGYTRKHVVWLVVTGKIAGQRRGRLWYVSRADLLAYLRTVEAHAAGRRLNTVCDVLVPDDVHDQAARRLVAAGLLQALKDAQRDEAARAWLTSTRAAALFEVYSILPEMIDDKAIGRVKSVHQRRPRSDQLVAAKP